MIRAAVLVSAAIALTACGGTKLGAPRCNAAQLAFVGGSAWSEATGQHTTPVQFENVSRTVCALDGYPTLRIFGAHGTELAFTYTHAGDVMLAALKPHPVRIAPGGHAAFVFNKYRCDVHYTDYGKTVLVTFPGGAGSRVLAGFGRGGLDYCSEAPSL
ncbi:MAG TPA: DUF4232 domain-containing protein, partial [Casimicrobiaceae bacterium]|nr:DUF4232 domain-containing protein [Casimicrobiaceae bacterium]